LRSKQNVTLTPGGLLFLKEYENFSATYRKMINKAKSANEERTGVLSIGVHNEQKIDKNILEILNDYRMQHPNVDVRVQCLPYNNLKQSVLLGDLDLVYTLLINERDMAEMDLIKLNDLPIYVAISRSHPLSKYDELDYRLLNNEALLAIGSQSVRGLSDYAYQLCVQTGLKPREVREAPNFSTRHFWLAMGDGFSFLHEGSLYQEEFVRIYPLPDNIRVTRIMFWSKQNRNPALNMLLSQIQSATKL
jgi:DNA-binding transcriptional LysR family regulator